MKKPRKCGTCSACCTTHGVTELEKPHATSCDKLCAKGCSIYGQHPPSCKEFKCLWLHGALEGADRPDRLGIVFDFNEPHNGVQSLSAREYGEGAFEEYAGREAVQTLSELAPVLMFKADGSRYLIKGPRHLINQALGR